MSELYARAGERDFIERFEASYVPEPNSGCWLWLAYEKGGYGYIRVGGPQLRAHRVSFEMFCRPIKPGEVVRHRCDNTYCVNPDHLLGGTKADNNRDRKARGRNADKRGEKNPAATITASQAIEVKRRLALGTGRRDVAEQMGVSRNIVNMIDLGRIWRHV